MLLPLVLRKQLIFGDDAQYQALKALEAQEDFCDDCEGEGFIIIPCKTCNETGKKH